MASEAIELPKRPELVHMQAASGAFVDIVRRLPFNTYADACESLIVKLRKQNDSWMLLEKVRSKLDADSEKLIAELRRDNAQLQYALEQSESAFTTSRQAVLTEALEAVRGCGSDFPNASFKWGVERCESSVSRMLEVGK
jgi:hypothetical protein